eukprot:s5482_g5.t2
MELDRIEKGKSKGKDKGKDKGKGGKPKGKDKGKKGKPGDGKGWGSQPWSNQGAGKGWQQGLPWNQGGKQQGGGGKGKKLDPSLCAICWQRGHWKNECPNKGRGNQVEQSGGGSAIPSSASSASTATTSLPPSASARGVHRVEVAGVEGGSFSPVPEFFDMSELDDWDVFGSGGSQVMMVEAIAVAENDHKILSAGGAVPEDAEGVIRNYPQGVQHFAMDAFDGDGDWTYDPDLVRNVLALEVNGRKEDVEVVIDSGADVSVAPIWLAKSGTKVAKTGVVMQDAQGNRIPEVQTRLLDIQVPTVEGDSVLIREKFSIARISSVILSLAAYLDLAGSLEAERTGQP